MAEQSAFLTAFDEMQKKKGGFNAPAPLESVVDTVGQAPAVQSPFSQQAAAATNPLAAPIDLSAAPAVQAPQELTADSFGPVAFPGLQQQGMDTRLQASSEEQQRMNEMSKTLSDGQIQKEREGSTVGKFVENAAKKGFDYFFGAPTAEQAQNTLDTMPTDPDQRARLQATAAGEGVPSDLSKAGSFFFGRPEVAGDPNTLGAQAPAEVAAAAPEVMGTPESIADLLVNGTDVVTPEAITAAGPVAPQAQAPQGLNSTQAMLQERFGSPTISGIQSAEEGLGLRTDAQGRMIDPNVDRSSFEQASADREARQAARPDFGTAVSDRDRREARGEGISDADRSDIAKAQSPNASASDRARGMKVAEKAGLDWRTGQPLKQDKETGGLTDYQAITAQQRQTEIDLKIADGMEEKEAKREVAYEESRSNVRSTQDSFDKLRPVAEEIALLSGSKFTEGALGWTASKLPFSTDAAQIERLTTEFEGSAFLQGLIDAKAKGATFGALSEREGDRILGQWGKITSPKSTNPERIRAVNSMLESIQRSSERAASDHKEKFPNRSASSSKAKAQGSPEGKRHAKDQDHGAKVDTHFQT
tara:strand:- start:525 stop:2291 length:1767 start_codon:yes stop_codon:yes gene_type:complete